MPPLKRFVWEPTSESKPEKRPWKDVGKIRSEKILNSLIKIVNINKFKKAQKLWTRIPIIKTQLEQMKIEDIQDSDLMLKIDRLGKITTKALKS